MKGKANKKKANIDVMLAYLATERFKRSVVRSRLDLVGESHRTSIKNIRNANNLSHDSKPISKVNTPLDILALNVHNGVEGSF